jgi:hypothetical protein
LSIGERVSQEVSPPFCVLPTPSRQGRGSPWPLFVLLAVGGTGSFGGGIWWLIVDLSDYGVAIVIMIVGWFLLWLAVKVFRTIDADDGWWLGFDHERFYMRMGSSLASWPWADVGSFRVAETVTSAFVPRLKRPDPERPDLNEAVDFKQVTSVTLSAEAREGPPISIPFDIFVPEGGRDLDRAENFCRFLNDMRQRAKSGGLVHGASPFLVPIELAIMPMKDGAPAYTRSRIKGNATPVVQRQ